MQIPPFELTKVIETVVKVERSLPRYIVKHLIRIEERVLEELGWADSSPLWASLTKKDEKTFTEERFEQIQEATLSPKKPQGHALRLLASPPRASAPPSGAPSVPQTPSKALSSSDIFMRKVAHLAGLRLRELTAELGGDGLVLSANTTKQVEHLMTVVLTQQPQLMRSRHLDQLLLSVIYGILKVNHVDKITFKLLIEKYLSQPQADAKVPLSPVPRAHSFRFIGKSFWPMEWSGVTL